MDIYFQICTKSKCARQLLISCLTHATYTYIRNNKSAVRRYTTFIIANVKAATYVCYIFWNTAWWWLRNVAETWSCFHIYYNKSCISIGFVLIIASCINTTGMSHFGYTICTVWGQNYDRKGVKVQRGPYGMENRRISWPAGIRNPVSSGS